MCDSATIFTIKPLLFTPVGSRDEQMRDEIQRVSRTLVKLMEVSHEHPHRSTMIYWRGKIWWFNFVYNGKHIQKSTRQRNKQVARDSGSGGAAEIGKG